MKDHCQPAESPVVLRALDGQFPGALLEMREKAPKFVYLWGKLPPRPWVSIVGTRKPTEQGRRAAFLLAKDLAQCGVSILSGGALGIDTAAHQGAIAGGGKTLVIAPAWLSCAYPPQNREYFRELIDAGSGYLSITESEQPASHPLFFQRNFALMAMSAVVVLGDCPSRSGAKNAMQYARRLGRPRYCLPTSYGQPCAFGNHEEVVRFGAQPLVSARPILDFLIQGGASDNPRFWDYLERRKAEQAERQRARPQSKRTVAPEGSVSRRGAASSKNELLDFGGAPHHHQQRVGGKTPQHQLAASRILKALGQGKSTVDSICQLTGLPVEQVQHQIMLLTLEGLVFEDESGILRYHSQPHE